MERKQKKILGGVVLSEHDDGYVVLFPGSSTPIWISKVGGPKKSK